MLICIILIFIIISLLVARKNVKDYEDEKRIRIIYTYLILVISLFIIIFGLIYDFKILLDILLPEESVYMTDVSYDLSDRNSNYVYALTTASLVITSIYLFIYHNKIAKELRNEEKEVVS